jgi:hypothetical protein
MSFAVLRSGHSESEMLHSRGSYGTVYGGGLEVPAATIHSTKE